MSAGRTLFVAASLSLPLLSSAQSAVATDFDPATGTYRISDRATGWSLSGSVGPSVRHVTRREGKDRVGVYREIAFDWQAEVGMHGVIRTYENRRSVLFQLDYAKHAAKSVSFPNFTSIPRDLKGFSYQDTTFAPGRFELAKTSTPWLFFDSKFRAFIVSPAANFMVAKMTGDGQTAIGCAMNDRLSEVPKGVRQQCLLSFGVGIGRTWDEWGTTLRALYNRKPATVDSDVIVKTFGYWTDNGADYYYNYDLSKGYAQTLLDLHKRYEEEGIHLGYLQLDSWWYRKLGDSISGEPSPDRKNHKLPESDWNKYGGILEYRATKDLFPNGLDAFSRDFGKPLAVHSRWIDLNSPYRSRYEVMGVAPVDPRYWKDVADYLHASGVTCFEQDWLDHIYEHSPEMASKLGAAERFTDSMADSMRERGITLQYCMPTPRFILKGVEYPNLTTIRTSPDRFEPSKWSWFLFGSQFAQEVGAYPWTDVFKSKEMGNLILSVLSAGPVGTGDAIGKEVPANILKAARPDGVLVKPDQALLPTDTTYLNESEGNHQPFVATTYTDHNGYRTGYLFAFPRGGAKTLTLRARDFGLSGRICIYEPSTQTSVTMSATDQIEVPITDGYLYAIAAPVTQTGIALFGDLGKIVSTGKQRISKIEDSPSGLRLHVEFAKGEKAVTIEGLSEHRPQVTGGKLLRYDERTKRFAVEANPNKPLTLKGRP